MRAFAVGILGFVVGACSSSGEGSTEHPVEDAGGSDVCAPGSPLEAAFHPKMSAKGPAGYTLELLEALPPTPRQSAADGNSWKFSITGPDGNPVSSTTTVRASCAMLLMDHGCGPEAKVTALGGGVYVLEKISFVMPKKWTISIFVSDGAPVSDTIAFDVCVD